MSGIDIGQLGHVVSGAPLPAHPAEVGRIMESEVLEGREEAALQRLPEAKLDCSPSVEPGAHVDAVRPLRGGRETEKLLGPHMVQKVGVRFGLMARMMELIDDDHV